MQRSILAAAGLAALAACVPPPNLAPRADAGLIPVVHTSQVMGATLYVSVWDADSTRALSAIDAVLAAAMRPDADAHAALPRGVAEMLDSTGVDRHYLARGLAIDRGMEALRAAGVRRAVIDLGGEFAVLGSGPVGQRWSVGLPNPFHPGEVYAALQLDRGALATVAVREDSARAVASVAVLAPSSALAAALARAFEATSPEAGCRLAARYGVQAVWVRVPEEEEDEDRDADDGVDPELVVLTDGLVPHLELLSEEPSTEHPTLCSALLRR